MRVLIIGAGAVGFYLARRLSDQAQEVAIVDPDPAKIQHAADNLDVLAVQGNGAAPPTLEAAGLAKTDILVAASGVDEVNLMACLAASRQDVKVKVARVRHPEHFAPGSLLSLQDLGVDLVISPEQECAWEIFQLLATPAATDLARFAEGRVQLMGLRVRPGAPVEGRSLAAFDQEVGDRRFVVAAVVRDGETEIPTGDTVLRADDKIFLLAPSRQTRKLPALAGHDTHEVRRVIIAGGSDEAVYLAQHLSQHRISSTIVEQSRRRARELAELLPESLILRGDATDLELLQMEGVEGVDGFVALTDRDEVNMLVALLAKSLGADRVIPLVHRAEYMGSGGPGGARCGGLAADHGGQCHLPPPPRGFRDVGGDGQREPCRGPRGHRVGPRSHCGPEGAGHPLSPGCAARSARTGGRSHHAAGGRDDTGGGPGHLLPPPRCAGGPREAHPMRIRHLVFTISVVLLAFSAALLAATLVAFWYGRGTDGPSWPPPQPPRRSGSSASGRPGSRRASRSGRHTRWFLSPGSSWGWWGPCPISFRA